MIPNDFDIYICYCSTVTRYVQVDIYLELTRNSCHVIICLKKKKINKLHRRSLASSVHEELHFFFKIE